MKAFQLKIAIKNSHPPIWRRVIVPAGITFSQLSLILNEVMGWSSYHLFEFEFYHLELRITEDEDDFGYDVFDHLEAKDTFIREYLEDNDWFTYTYDLGDDWQHRVTIEKVLEDYPYDYPQVIKFKEDCPPEDCGGIWGYYNCLEIIGNKNHPEYEETLEWLDMQGYPQSYDMKAVNQKLQKMYFYQWGKRENRYQREILEEHLSGRYGLRATKRDKNHQEIIQSKKHQTEEMMRMMVDMLNTGMRFEQEAEHISLTDVLSDYDREDIEEIACVKGMKQTSGCSKNILIQKLVDFMLRPETIERYFLCLGDEEISEFEKALKCRGLYEAENVNAFERLHETGYVGMNSDGRFAVPTEVAEAYQAIKSKEFDKKRKNISYLLYCLETAAELYGITPVSILMEMLKTDPKVHIEETELKNIIENLPEEFADYLVIDDLVYCKEFYPDDSGLLELQGDLKYYIPNRDEILSVGIGGCLPTGREQETLEKYLVEHTDMFAEEVAFLGNMIQMHIMHTGEIEELFGILQEAGINIQNRRDAEVLAGYLIDVWNHTRMIINRGFTPAELGKKPEFKLEDPEQDNNIINFETARKKKKIYPNDPCPCGSGKKYKNCCGK